SEYGTMESVLMKRPEEAFVRQELIDEQWKELNFLHRPRLDQAIAEHEELRKPGSVQEVELLPLLVYQFLPNKCFFRSLH
ncbi:MAG: hypothetical protein AAGA85_22330, partial [Bacteroidota bacterium]